MLALELLLTETQKTAERFINATERLYQHLDVHLDGLSPEEKKGVMERMDAILVRLESSKLLGLKKKPEPDVHVQPTGHRVAGSTHPQKAAPKRRKKTSTKHKSKR